jgi:hypothetical protein
MNNKTSKLSKPKKTTKLSKKQLLIEYNKLLLENEKLLMNKKSLNTSLNKKFYWRDGKKIALAENEYYHND